MGSHVGFSLMHGFLLGSYWISGSSSHSLVQCKVDFRCISGSFAMWFAAFFVASALEVLLATSH